MLCQGGICKGFIGMAQLGYIKIYRWKINKTFSYYDERNYLGNSFNNCNGWVKSIVMQNNWTDKIKLTSNWYYLSSSFTSGICYNSQPQLEAGNFSTSFTSGSREHGNLVYNASVIDHALNHIHGHHGYTPLMQVRGQER